MKGLTAVLIAAAAAAAVIAYVRLSGSEKKPGAKKIPALPEKAGSTGADDWREIYDKGIGEEMTTATGSSMKELLAFLKDSVPNFYGFSLVTSSLPVTVLTNVLNDDLSVAFSSGITISPEKKIAMIVIKDHVSTRTIIMNRKLYFVNDNRKLYNVSELSEEELKDTARKLQRAFSISNYDLEKARTMKTTQEIGGVLYDAEAIDDGKMSCVVYADRITGRIKYMKSGGVLSEVKRYDNESIPSFCTIDPSYSQTDENIE